MYLLKENQTKAPIRSWLPPEQIDSGTWPQIIAVANHPEIGEAVALMPDAHVGYGVPIGCVMPTVNSVIPNAVGVDIGCGMSAIKTYVAYDKEKMDQGFWSIVSYYAQEWIPTGFNWPDKPDKNNRMPETEPWIKDELKAHWRRAEQQIGTLGGGNHFLEYQVDEEGWIWLMVHSGSRGIGKRIADWYGDLARTESKLRGLKDVKDLESLTLDDAPGRNYLHDMAWAMEYARRSREYMLHDLMMALAEALMETGERSAFTSEPIIDCSHNYAQRMAEGTVLHRKGATLASSGQLSIIPGSMGSSSFIVRGKDVEEAFYSCSHGAGRTMGRGQAKRNLTMDGFKDSIAGTFSTAREGYLDEAPLAYKNIHHVMAQQDDLIQIVHGLTPLLTIKGSSKARDD